jgi:hypothetical protein
MGTKKNIIIGSAKLSYSADGTTWTELGYTDDGVSQDYEPQFQDHYVDEEPGPVKKTKTGEKLTFGANLAENTLENYRIAMGLPSSAITTDVTAHTKTLDLISSSDIPEHHLKLEGKNPDNLDRVMTVDRVVSVGKVSTKHTNKNKKLITIQFEALKNDAGSYGKIVDTLPSA